MILNMGDSSRKSKQPGSILKKIQEHQKIRDKKMHEKYDEILRKMEKKNLVRKKQR